MHLLTRLLLQETFFHKSCGSNVCSSCCSLCQHIQSEMTESSTCVMSVTDVPNQGLGILCTNDIY